MEAALGQRDVEGEVEASTPQVFALRPLNNLLIRIRLGPNQVNFDNIMSNLNREREPLKQRRSQNEKPSLP